MVEPEIRLFAPEFLLDELLKHQDEISGKTKRSREELASIFETLKEKINFVPMKEFESFLEKAIQISPDPGDVPYLALALQFKIPIWSNDRDLKEKQRYVQVYSTRDLLDR